MKKKLQIWDAENLQQFVEVIPDNYQYGRNDGIKCPEAIFIPFRGISGNIKILLQDLQWYEGPIYLMPSDCSDMIIVNENQVKVIELSSIHHRFINFFYNLSTSTHKHTNRLKSVWDLPLKRNYALWFARKMGYKNILLMDDDIRGLNLKLLDRIKNYLQNYCLFGCFVNEFPDLSILDHFERISGKRKYPFLSGSFLFVKPFEVNGFFPNIYNEDWLFMLPHVIEGTICSLGEITQEAYDPFCAPNKARFQEFGDIVVGGLYDIMCLNQYDSRFELEVWNNIIAKRKDIWRSMNKVFHELKHERIITASLQANSTITGVDCLKFVESWEKDISLWSEFIEESIKSGLF